MATSAAPDVVKIDKKEHQLQLGGQLELFYRDQEMCDVTLVSGCKPRTVTSTIKAHRIVLAANSEYFRALFVGNKLQKSETDFVLPDVMPAGLKAIVEFCYHGQITVDKKNLADIVAAIYKCQLVKAYEILDGYICKHFDETNFKDIVEIAEMYKLKPLQAKLVEVAGKKFLPNIPTPDINAIVNNFAKVTPDFFKSVLKKWDYSAVGFSKPAVYNFIVLWVKQDPEKREASLPGLLEVIAGKENVLEVMRYFKLTAEEKRKEAESAGPTFVAGITEIDMNCSIIARDNLLLVDTEKKVRKQIGLFPWPHTDFWKSGIAILDNVLYVFGGSMYGREQGIDRCHKYDPCQDRWFPIKSLQTPRCLCPAVALQGKLYVFGGWQTAEKILDSVEIYDPVTDTWSYGVQLPYAVYGHVAATYQDKVYVAGGCLKPKGNRLKRFYSFDPETSKWQKKENMKLARIDHDTFIHNDCLFQVSGLKDGTIKDTDWIEYYDLSNNNSSKWMKVDFPDQGCFVLKGACCINDIIYLLTEGPDDEEKAVQTNDDDDDEDESDSFSMLTKYESPTFSRLRVHRFDPDSKEMVNVFEEMVDEIDSYFWLHALKFPKFILDHMPQVYLKVKFCCDEDNDEEEEEEDMEANE